MRVALVLILRVLVGTSVSSIEVGVLVGCGCGGDSGCGSWGHVGVVADSGNPSEIVSSNIRNLGSGSVVGRTLEACID